MLVLKSKWKSYHGFDLRESVLKVKVDKNGSWWRRSVTLEEVSRLGCWKRSVQNFFYCIIVVEVSSRSFLRACTSYLRSVQLRNAHPYHVTLCEPHAIRISSCCDPQCVPWNAFPDCTQWWQSVLTPLASLGYSVWDVLMVKLNKQRWLELEFQLVLAPRARHQPSSSTTVRQDSSSEVGWGSFMFTRRKFGHVYLDS